MPNAEPLEPEVLAALDAIDATLHGEPVDPEHAELAELALILRDDRPVPSDAFLHRLDRRVQDRFAVPVGRPRARAGRWRLALAALTAAAALGLAVIVVAGRSPLLVRNGPATAAGGHAAAGVSTSSAAGGAASPSSGSPSTPAASAPGGSAGGAAQTAKVPSRTPTPRVGSSRAPTPRVGSGRDLTQSARLGLEAGAGQVAPVAQEVFDVIGREHGVVLRSHVTEAKGFPGFAAFSLQVPAGRLETTLDRLSRLRHAHVTMREDASADITSHVDNTAAALAAVVARRRSLLRQLAGTAVPAEAGRLQREAARALAQIDRLRSELERLRHRVASSTIDVTVQAPPVIEHRHHATGGFTFARALRDAGHILLIAAGVTLIALAVLVPLGLVAGICAWVWSLVLRHRREGALGPAES